jgi:hypothetical protein
MRSEYAARNVGRWVGCQGGTRVALIMCPHRDRVEHPSAQASYQKGTSQRSQDRLKIRVAEVLPTEGSTGIAGFESR